MVMEGVYGGRLAKLFSKTANPSPIVVKSIVRGSFAATRMSCDDVSTERTRPASPEDTFALCLRLKRQRADIWIDGRASTKSAIKGETSAYDLRSEIMLHFKDPIDFLSMYIPRRALVEIADQEGAPSTDFSVPLGSFPDPIIAHLGACLLPALDNPREANGLFVEHVAIAVQTHFLAHYVSRCRPIRPHRSGLTARQLRIAKQAIHANLDGSMSLGSIARECGLSPSHFARAFAVSVGRPPHQWLLDQRVDMARQLLSDSTLPIAEIAIQCGFADQSHFTRVFSARTGLSPGRWRRVHKL
jgi:AraC family transcriptional regulator